MLNLLSYDEIGRMILIAIPAGIAIVLPIVIGHIIYKAFIDYLQSLIDRLQRLLTALSLDKDMENDDDGNS